MSYSPQDAHSERGSSEALLSEPSMASTAPKAANGPKQIERSCAVCHRRKIRCDKKSPCATCVRAGVLCCYPTSEPTPRRQRKTTIADVANRLARLERTIVAISADPVADDSNDTARPRASDTSMLNPVPGLPASSSTELSTSDEVLVQNGSSSRYFNELLLSRVIKEEQEIQSILTNPSDDPPPYPAASPFNLMGILSSASGSPADDFDLHPPTWKALQLWQIFLNNVEPAVKVIHVPTDQVAVLTAIDSPSDASPAMDCFLFAIYFAATASLESPDAYAILGQEKASALGNFKQGMEQSLARSNFLENPTVKSLQALGIYLAAIRTQNHGRAVWVLNGLAIRAAQSIGLHRNGEDLKLPPFEAEIRRRLWWSFMINDGRAAEFYGVSNISLFSSSDIRLPLNVDDSDLYPGMTELPPQRQGWSVMTFDLVKIETVRSAEQLQHILTSSGDKASSEAARKKIMDELTTRVEGHLQHCNPVVPMQRMALFVCRLIVTKLKFVSRQEWLNAADPRRHEVHEDNLADACESLELCLRIGEDPFLRQYRWLRSSFPSYKMLLYVLWHFCVQPLGPGVPRAWDLANRVFDLEHGLVTNHMSGQYSTWEVLKLLRAKAIRIRESALRDTEMSEVPGQPANQNSLQQVDRYGEAGFQESVGSGAAWDKESDAFPDWNALAEGFNLDRYDYSNFL